MYLLGDGFDLGWIKLVLLSWFRDVGWQNYLHNRRSSPWFLCHPSALSQSAQQYFVAIDMCQMPPFNALVDKVSHKAPSVSIH